MTIVPRRRVLKAAGFAGLALLVPPELLAACSTANSQSSARSFLVFDPHEALVVEEATARLIPGPHDDPSEMGHPGAREANVTRYIDTMLGALMVSPPRVFAGGPFSDRAGSRVDDMAKFLRLTAAEVRGWTERLDALRAQYRQGVKALDRLAGGDFPSVSADKMDAILAQDPEGFMTLLFGHAIEGMYSAPEYGGNAGLAGWHDIAWVGDRQPRGYSDAEVTFSDGPDVYVPDGIGAQLLSLLTTSPI
ncbi:MAG: gluconate 2-dehydrogenase subunit 3 family protein [Acidimicrobiales bacterium]|jgi:hypothetical protein